MINRTLELTLTVTATVLILTYVLFPVAGIVPNLGNANRQIGHHSSNHYSKSFSIDLVWAEISASRCFETKIKIFSIIVSINS